MNQLSVIRSFLATSAAALLVACGGGGDAVASDTRPTDAARQGWIDADHYRGIRQTNLVANRPGYGAALIEPELRNAWGIAIRPAGLGGHFWIGASKTAQSIEYVGDVGATPLFQDELKTVHTLGPTTGVVFNPGAQFVITQPHGNGSSITNAAKFLFANLSGTITAWTEKPNGAGGFDRPDGSVTVVDATARHSAFVGVAVSPAADRLYAADFGAQPALRVYDGAFAEVGALANPFRPGGQAEPEGFEAFNVQTLGEPGRQRVFVGYGRHVAPGAPLPPEGRLAEFDADGRLVGAWDGKNYLNYPWGMAIAPEGFGLYADCLLVGNFGDGTIVAFDPRRKEAVDYVRDAKGERVVIDGLWGLQFGNGASLGEADRLYFAAGPAKEADGLFGKLQADPPAAAGDASLCR